jgi:phosphoribosyl 1,2-cyclic phosphodiesterase
VEPLNIQVLRSSSAGNCTALWNGQGRILIDAGIPVWVLKQYLLKHSGAIDSVIITHAHHDHLSNACCNFFIKNNIPVYFGNPAIKLYYQKRLSCLAGTDACLKVFHEKQFEISGYQIHPFRVQHDSIGGCFGFKVICNKKKITYATDLVDTPDALLDHFRDSDAIIIESNHDPDMLENSGRPPYIIRRIRERAHLSNGKCADFLMRILKDSKRRPKHIMPAHISTECNERGLVKKHVREMLHSAGCSDTQLTLTFHDRESSVVTI